MPRLLLAALTASLAAMSGDVAAQGARASSPAELARQADALKPGQWVWAPQVSPAGPILIYVDLSRQIATVYRNGVRIGVSTISSGKEGHETPTGVFTILQKDADHRSNKYNSAPMPYMQRLTWDGVALHAGGLPGYPESHGCVHLPFAFSKLLFGVTTTGATVVVEGNAATHVRTTDGSLLAPLTEAGAAQPALDLAGQPWRWDPQKAPSGPLTIVVSKSDQTIVVLRNGVEIGRSRAVIRDTDTGSHVIQLMNGPGGRPRWTYVGIAGHEDEAGREVDEAVLNRVALPAPFHDAVKAALKPGATILVTQSPVGEGSSGQPLTIMDAVSPQP